MVLCGSLGGIDWGPAEGVWRAGIVVGALIVDGKANAAGKGKKWKRGHSTQTAGTLEHVAFVSFLSKSVLYFDRNRRKRVVTDIEFNAVDSVLPLQGLSLSSPLLSLLSL